MKTLLNILQDGREADRKTIVVSISPQSRVSLAAKYNLTQQEAAMKLTSFFKSLGI